MARRFFRDTGRGDRPDNVGLFRPAGRGPGDGGDRPRVVPREAADEPAPPPDRPEGVERFPQAGPRGRPDPGDGGDRSGTAPPAPAEEPAPPTDRPKKVGLFRAVRAGGAPGGGDRLRGVPRESADERAAAAAGSGASPPPREPPWPQDAAPLPAEADPAPPEDARLRTVSWRNQENSWLHGRVEDLERQLRQRTVALGVSALAAVVALASLTVVLLRDPEPATVAFGAGSTADTWFALVPPGSLDGSDQQATAGSGADPARVQAALSAALARIEELETADDEREATIGALRAELDGTRAEAQTLREHLDVSRRGIERLNALLARATGAEPSVAPPAPAPVETAPVDTAAVETAAPGAAAEAAGPRADGTPYVTTAAVNLRAEPTTAAEVLTVIDEGDVVLRVGGDGEWLQVEHADPFVGVVTGWVYSDLVRPAMAPPDGG